MTFRASVLTLYPEMFPGALGLSLATLPADMPEGPGAWQIATWLIMVGFLTFGFLRLCRARTDGEWRWRWGKQR